MVTRLEFTIGVFGVEKMVTRLSQCRINWPFFLRGLEPASHTSQALEEQYLNAC
jgi:hypothetical protein